MSANPRRRHRHYCPCDRPPSPTSPATPPSSTQRLCRRGGGVCGNFCRRPYRPPRRCRRAVTACLAAVRRRGDRLADLARALSSSKRRRCRRRPLPGVLMGTLFAAAQNSAGFPGDATRLLAPPWGRHRLVFRACEICRRRPPEPRPKRRTTRPPGRPNEGPAQQPESRSSAAAARSGGQGGE